MSGEYALHATLAHRHVAGSPFTLRVLSGALSARCSLLVMVGGQARAAAGGGSGGEAWGEADGWGVTDSEAADGRGVIRTHLSRHIDVRHLQTRDALTLALILTLTLTLTHVDLHRLQTSRGAMPRPLSLPLPPQPAGEVHGVLVESRDEHGVRIPHGGEHMQV